MSILDSAYENGANGSRRCTACHVAKCTIRRHIADSFGDSVPADFEVLQVLRAQAVVLPQGDTSELRFVVDGMIMVENALPDGRRQVTGFRARGDLLCFASPSGGIDYTMTAVAPTLICRVRPMNTGEGRRLREALVEALFDTACARIAWADQHLLVLARLTAREKVASFLLEMALRIGRTGPAGVEIELPMNREVIADYLGLNAETVSRQFTRLKRLGAIALPRPGLVLVPELARLSEETPVSWFAEERPAASFAEKLARSLGRAEPERSATLQ